MSFLILAPSYSGKSYFAKKGFWTDGDVVIRDGIGWPKNKTWWKDPVLKAETNDANASQILAHLVRHQSDVVAFNQILTDTQISWFKRLGIKIIVFVPPQETILENRNRRALESPDRYVQSDAEIEGNRVKILQMARWNSLRVVDNVSDLPKTVFVRPTQDKENSDG